MIFYKILMGVSMERRKKVNILFYASSFVIFGLSALSHFLYKWSGYNGFVGIFAPTNESVFQHLKMFFYPTVLYYFIVFFVFGKKYDMNANKWYIAPLITVLLTSSIVVSMYYTTRFGFNVESMFIDIVSLFLGLFISSIICKSIYKNKRTINFPSYVSVVILLIMTISVAYYDANPKEVDLFYDHQNNTYYEVKD